MCGARTVHALHITAHVTFKPALSVPNWLAWELLYLRATPPHRGAHHEEAHQHQGWRTGIFPPRHHQPAPHHRRLRPQQRSREGAFLHEHNIEADFRAEGCQAAPASPSSPCKQPFPRCPPGIPSTSVESIPPHRRRYRGRGASAVLPPEPPTYSPYFKALGAVLRAADRPRELSLGGGGGRWASPPASQCRARTPLRRTADAPCASLAAQGPGAPS